MTVKEYDCTVRIKRRYSSEEFNIFTGYANFHIVNRKPNQVNRNKVRKIRSCMGYVRIAPRERIV